MRQILPEKRLTQCLELRAARDLAKRYGADEEQAGLAGLLHDYAKKLSDQEFLDLIDRYELDSALKTGATMSGMGWSGFTRSAYTDRQIQPFAVLRFTPWE